MNMMNLQSDLISDSYTICTRTWETVASGNGNTLPDSSHHADSVNGKWHAYPII